MTAQSPPERQIIRPQPGPQSIFLSSPADIAVYGGAAGGGKTWALLMEPLRHVHRPTFGAVFFRRNSKQIRNEGGLWDESQKLYPHLGATANETRLEWRFPSGAKIRFAQLQHEKTKQEWQGSQIALLAFDELTHFTESQFFYLLSRNRSLSGVRPYVRASTNPDALSWVKTFLAPWLAPNHPQRAESGELRWFVRDGGQILWVDAGTPDAKSVAFVRSSIYDNQILLRENPEYLANLKAMSLVDRARLLDGDWDIVPGGNMFRREWFGLVDAAPAGPRLVRFWDLAATEAKPGKDPDWTVGVLLGKSSAGLYYVLDVQRTRATPGSVAALVKQTAELDRDRYGSVAVRMEQEPGSSGVAVISSYVKLLDGFDFRGKPSTGPKAERAKPFSAQAEAGNVKILRDPLWNNDFLNELSAFPTEGVHDDQVDAVSGAYELLARERGGRWELY